MRMLGFDQDCMEQSGTAERSEEWRRDAPSTELRTHAGPVGARDRGEAEEKTKIQWVSGEEASRVTLGQGWSGRSSSGAGKRSDEVCAAERARQVPSLGFQAKQEA